MNNMKMYVSAATVLDVLSSISNKTHNIHEEENIRSLGQSVVNVTYILLAQISLHQKKFNLYFKHKKALRKTFVQKNPCVKCW
jgi:hypothetical protein